MRRKASLYIASEGGDWEQFPFVEEIVIGRRQPPDGSSENVLVLQGKQVSGRHCVLTQSAEGAFCVRDVSRNGVKLDGRRIVPNVEVEVETGTVITIGGHSITLQIEATEDSHEEPESGYDYEATEAQVGETPITVLVGDIRGYTTLSQQFSPSMVAESVTTVFETLARRIEQFKGTVKEYQGDAVVAFWEGEMMPPFQFTLDACMAAMWLDYDVRCMAADENLWKIREFPLQMEFALSSGMVSITTVGGSLAIVGDPVNYAFRLEKLANEETGTILACNTTQLLARTKFEFRALGDVKVKGRAAAEPIFSLVGENS